ncbi:hypothetical protein SAMN06298221_103255 [Sphaerochaeta associata]|uniref:Capsule assembly protein Wzi n=1 Tax=Sphaerochaeta associata TaxID=1129264 RepID=A0ABY4DD87_9SPIR|nr:hypothetical protein [Sphaerochaeta associata]UOM52175.1 hypothetical protein MUG09_05220 [Sphaerochaeta associata]SMP46327.1 hypothetical protein SAMN06298221_103255 [Sphaerochaeta associata]
MKHTRLLCIILICFFGMASIPAAVHTSVPVDHRVYRILDVAQIRGLIDNQIDVKPYSASKVISLLETIAGQPEALRKGEAEEVDEILSHLYTTYGTSPSYADKLFSTGFLRTYDEEKQLGASMGITLASQQTISLNQKGEFDSRNGVVAFLKGDIGPNISFNMDFGMVFDQLNNRVFLPSEFTIPGEGFYLLMLEGGKPAYTIPFDSLYTSLTLTPEVSGSFFDGSLLVRWGTLKRDWGPGLNNLMLSADARSFDAIELQLLLTPWFRFSVMNGSLGKFSLRNIDGAPFFSDFFGAKEDRVNYRFDNNFSAHRVEIDFTKNFTFSIFESTVWQKRFELSYLNPATIYMFQQNSMGDIDDLFAGVDATLTLPSKARLYGAMAMNEMNVVGNPITMLKAPRNMFAFQAGVVVPLPIGTFSSLTFQWTYIGPFVYTHYPMRKLTGTIDTTYRPNGFVVDNANPIVITTDTGRTVTYDGTSITLSKKGPDEEETIGIAPADVASWYSNDTYTLTKDGRTMIEKKGNDFLIYETYSETAYVNKGENLGYPLQPNSQEFLLQLDLGLPKGWTTQFQAKYQARSGQYGYSLDQFMLYAIDDQYPEKDFWNHVFNHTLSILVSGTKKLDGMPISLTASYRFIADWERPIDESTERFDGLTTIFGAWQDPVFNHIVQVGVKIFY